MNLTLPTFFQQEFLGILELLGSCCLQLGQHLLQLFALGHQAGLNTLQGHLLAGHLSRQVGQCGLAGTQLGRGIRSSLAGPVTTHANTQHQPQLRRSEGWCAAQHKAPRGVLSWSAT